ncbi:hypothetical protein MTO96_031166 [Rhipicephalus appendiculatus]
MFDTDNDGDLDCLVTVRSNFDEEGPQGHLHVASARSQRSARSDGSEKVANFIYSDNEKCTVLEIPYKNDQECILWVNPKILKDVPQHCLDYYDDNCDMKNPAYDEQSCGPIIAKF